MMMKMSISLSASEHPQPLLSFARGMEHHKDKVVVVMGATGTGKSRLSIDLATRFDGEIINSDKIQVHRGLDVVTNKVTDQECRGVPHHLLGIIEPDVDFSANEFVHRATIATDAITHRGRLPIIAGGSNSCIRALVNDNIAFRTKYECCFLCVDVSTHVLHSFVDERVDRMVESGLVDECREFFQLDGNYTRGIRRAIGVPELDALFRNESFVDGEARAKLLDDAIGNIKANTRNLVRRQLKNIIKLEERLQCHMHRLNATEAFLKHGEEADEAWEELVVDPGTRIVGRFLCEHSRRMGFVSSMPPTMATSGVNLGRGDAAIATAATH